MFRDEQEAKQAEDHAKAAAVPGMLKVRLPRSARAQRAVRS